MRRVDKLTIQCFGECGCSVIVRASKVRHAQFYLCRSKTHRYLCLAKLPSLPPDKFRRIDMDAAGGFCGYTYEFQHGRGEKLTIHCFGNCGCAVTLRKSKVRPADFYVCNSSEHGMRCEAKLPALPPGMVRNIEFNAASCLTGYTYQWPDAETAAAVQRAKSYVVLAVADIAIERARRASRTPKS